VGVRNGLLETHKAIKEEVGKGGKGTPKGERMPNAEQDGKGEEYFTVNYFG